MANNINGFVPPCVPPEQVDEAADLYTRLVTLLESFQKCRVTFDDDVTDEDQGFEGAVSLSLVKSVLLAEAGIDQHRLQPAAAAQ